MRSAALRLGGPIQPASFSSVTRASSNLRRILSIEGLPNAVLFEFLGKALVLMDLLPCANHGGNCVPTPVSPTRDEMSIV